MTKKYLRIGGFGFFSMAFLALSSRMAFAHGGYGGGWGMGPGMMGGWGTGWWGFIPMFLFWGLIIAGVVFLIKVLAQGKTRGENLDPGSSQALEALKERFARGEITKEEFGQMKKVIQT